MNKIYRLVRDRDTGEWVVASELAKGRGKRNTLAVAIAAAALMAAAGTNALTVAMPDFNPNACDDLSPACTTTVSGGANVTLTGSGAQIASGSNGQVTQPLSALFASGQITAGGNYVDPSNPDSLVINIGGLTRTVLVPDPISGGTATVTVYDNGAIIDTHAGTSASGPYRSMSFNEVGDDEYINARLGQVDSTGGTLNVQIGTGGATNAVPNSIRINAKQTELVVADGSAGGTSAANWVSDNFIDFGSPVMTAQFNATTSTSLKFSTYNGSVTAFDGSVHTVTSAAELQAYNTWLVDKLQAGALSPALYVAEFKKAYTDSTQIVSWKSAPSVDPNDDIYKLMGDRMVMHAKGGNATATIAAGKHLDVTNVANSGGRGAVMLADGGGLVSNEGTLGVVGGGSADAGQVGTGLWAEGAGSRAKNSGVIGVGYFTGLGGNIDPVQPIELTVNNRGMYAKSLASAENTGIINVAGTYSNGMYVESGGNATNSGNINVGVTTVPDDFWLPGLPSRGALVHFGGSFTNQADGEIYLGRGAQYSLTDATADVAKGSTPLIGVITISGMPTENKGRIVIGSLAQNSTGMWASASGGGMINSGSILIKETGASSPLSNVAMLAEAGSSNVQNSGQITIDGTNAVGMKVIGGSSASNTGTINLNGGVSPLGLHNYGVYTDGLGSKATLMGGAVNLKGDGAIGAHARNASNITVSGDVNFVSGVKQIGYFAYGAGASIDVDNAPATGLDVSTDGSTLFRVEDGAAINNNVASALTASGAGSTAMQVTGAGTTANLDLMDIRVSGDNAVGVRVEGGATGSMSSAANLSLTGTGSIGVVVDNNKYDVNGAMVTPPTPAGPSVFTNTANVSMNGASDVTAFVVKNGATLANTGNLSVGHGTAIELVGAGSSVTPSSGTITVDDGKAGIYVHGGASLSSNDAITVGGTAAGILAGSDAGPVTVASGAHITGTGNSYGALVVNQGAASNVKVDGATLEMQGSGAALVMDNNLDASSHGTVLVSSTSGGKGIAISDATGGLTSDGYTVDGDWDIQVSGNGAGVYANTSGDVVLDGSQITVTPRATSGAAAVLVQQANELKIARGTTLTVDNADATLIRGNPTTLINEGTLDATDASRVAVKLSDDGHAFVNAATGAITGGVSMGNGTNTATLQNGSRLDGTLSGGVGNDTVTVQGDATFTAIDGGIGGDDLLVFDGASYTYNDPAALLHFNTVQLSNNASLTLQQALMASDDEDDRSTIAIDAGSTLAIAPSTPAAFVLNNDLSGAGLVTVNTGAGNAFDFGEAGAAATATAFTGTVALGNSTFRLEGDNATALTSATLRADSGSVTTVGTGVQNVGNVTFNGGTMIFDADAPDATVAANRISTNHLDTSGGGVVRVNVPAPYLPSPVDTPDTANLLEQDDANIGLKLVDAASASGGSLSLQDHDGNAISNAKHVDIEQDGNIVADATYDFGTTTQAHGLYVNYGLKQLDLQAGQTLTLQQGSGATGTAADMAARIIGTGSLAVDAGAGIVSLSNGTNTYSGDTQVNSGTLLLKGDNVLGNTDTLRIASGASVDMGGKAQTIQQLDGQGGSTLDVNGGELTVADGGVSLGELTGSGQLNVTGGVLDVAGANADLTADAVISSGAKVSLNDAAGLGSGDVANEGTLALDAATGTLANNVSGSGEVNAINNADVVLAGDNSGFAGTFDIEAGSRLTAGSQSNLGTAAVAVDGTLGLNGYVDTLGNALSGTCTVNTVAGSDVTLGADNSAFTGTFDIDAGTTLRASEENQLSSADIGNEGVLAINNAADFRLDNTVHGAGNLVKQGEGTLIVGDALAYTGETVLEAGTTIVGDAAVPAITLGGSGAGDVTVKSGATLAGVGVVSGKVINEGTVSAFNALPGRLAEAASTFVLAGGLDNNAGGVVKLAGGQVGNVLQVNGDYAGNGGTLELNTVLGDDASATDRLVVRGDTSGSTSVIVHAAGDTGQYTTGDGIQIVQVDGASRGTFALGNRVVAGSREYLLFQNGKSDPTDGDWYLRSEAPLPPTCEDTNTCVPEPPTPECEGANDCTQPIPDPDPNPVPAYRPEPGAYLGNQAAALGMLQHTLHDRLGEVDFDQRQRSGDDRRGAVWTRVAGDHSNGKTGGDQIDVGTHSNLLQVGGEFGSWTDGDSRWQLGAMGTIGQSETKVGSTLTHYQAKATMKAQILGVYGTWYQNASKATGLYVDSWAQAGRFDNTVEGDQLAREQYDAKAWAASLEAGYAFELGRGERSAFYVEPQAQVIYRDYRADDHVEANGTLVTTGQGGGVVTRLGARAYARPLTDAHNRVQPFVEANWWHDGDEQSIMMNGERQGLSASKDVYELKLGAQAELGARWTGWGHLGLQRGDGGEHNVEAQIGVKYGW